MEAVDGREKGKRGLGNKGKRPWFIHLLIMNFPSFFLVVETGLFYVGLGFSISLTMPMLCQGLVGSGKRLE